MSNLLLTTKATLTDPVGNTLDTGVIIILLTGGNYNVGGQEWIATNVTRTGNKLEHPTWTAQW